jgi:hypothetical protein
MPTRSDLEKELIELQNQYHVCLCKHKDFSEVKAIKNNIKKLHTAMNMIDRAK